MVEDTLPISQCGFRHGRGCIAMMFCARQIMEKARGQHTKIFMLFVDLRKAYDSVPRQALWLVLERYGIPPLLVRLIQSLHDEMKVEVSVDGATTPVIEVNNGLRQGCTIVRSVEDDASLSELSCCTSVVASWWGRGREDHHIC